MASDRRGHIVSALRAAGADGISGERLAEELGVSRVSISKHVAALRELGYVIESVTGKGYELISSPDLALPFEVTPLLKGRFRDIRGGGATGSTNDDAKELAHEGVEEGVVVLATKQTAGRGRLGRAWSSPEGGLYLSFVVRPQTTPDKVSSLALVIALGVITGLERLGIDDARLKWPNDVLLPQGKLCGILLELFAQVDRVDAVIAGIGVNVDRDLYESSPGQSASATTPDGANRMAFLSDVVDGAMPSRAHIAAAIIDGVSTVYDEWVLALNDIGSEIGGSLTPFIERYTSHLTLMGQSVTVRRIDGEVVASGVAQGIDGYGRLLINTGDVVVPVSSGDVTLRT